MARRDRTCHGHAGRDFRRHAERRSQRRPIIRGNESPHDGPSPHAPGCHPAHPAVGPAVRRRRGATVDRRSRRRARPGRGRGPGPASKPAAGGRAPASVPRHCGPQHADDATWRSADWRRSRSSHIAGARAWATSATTYVERPSDPSAHCRTINSSDYGLRVRLPIADETWMALDALLRRAQVGCPGVAGWAENGRRHDSIPSSRASPMLLIERERFTPGASSRYKGSVMIP